jgi:hypothetical protein
VTDQHNLLQTFPIDKLDYGPGMIGEIDTCVNVVTVVGQTRQRRRHDFMAGGA